jgi:hypothetical protein
MYIATVPNRGSPPAILLREGYREGGKVKTRTLANLSHWSAQQVERLRAVLRGDDLVPAQGRVECIRSWHHGDVQAVLLAMRRLGLEALIRSRPAPERSRVLAMVAARILDPESKLATARSWHASTLPAQLGVTDADEDDLYSAMDWLVQRQERIEAKLAARHLREGGLVLYDLSSSYLEGTACPLGALGHSRDGKKGTLQVNYGLLTDARGCPVAVSVFPGNTADSTTLLPQVKRLRERFGLDSVVVVGDRGMIGQKQIGALAACEGVDWITALKTGSIRRLIEGGRLQLGLFDERNLFEFSAPEFPEERLIACRNPDLQALRAHKRQSLLDASERELEKVRASVAAGRLRGADRIGVRVGRVVNKYKMAKHFVLDIGEDRFEFRIDADKVAAEATLDGVYVIRTRVPRERLDAPETVRSYKQLAQVERAFRSLKTVDLKVRPIYHHLQTRVRAHIFLCTLAYYVEWHMREAWRPLTFADEDQAAKQTRDPVAAATRSDAALLKVSSRHLQDGSPAHSFRTLLQSLSAIVRNLCRLGTDPDAPTFELLTTPDPTQQRALDLLGALSP